MAKSRKTKPAKAHKAKAAKPQSVEKISDDQRQAIFIAHKRSIAPLLNRLAEAQTNLKNAYGLAKAEGVSKKALEFAHALETDAGEAAALAEHAWKTETARWCGVEYGTQLDMFPEKKKATSKHHADGKRTAMEGGSRKPPAHIGAIGDVDAWFAGFDEGVKAVDAIAKVGRGAGATVN